MVWCLRACGPCSLFPPVRPHQLLQTLPPLLLPTVPQRVRAADSLVPSGAPRYDPVYELVKQAALLQVWEQQGGELRGGVPACLLRPVPARLCSLLPVDCSRSLACFFDAPLCLCLC